MCPHDVSHGQHDVFVQHEAQEDGHPSVRSPAMAQEQRNQKPKLRDRHVTGLDGLIALLASNADAHVRSLEHGHIIRAITNCQRDPSHVEPPHQFHELALLLRRQPTTYARTARDRQFVQHGSTSLRHQDKADECAVQHKTTILDTLKMLLGFFQQLDGLLLASAVRQGREDHVLGEQLAGPDDFHSRLGLVAREHPETNAGLLDQADGLGNALLKLILDGADPGQCERVFHLGRQSRDRLVADVSLRVPREPLLEEAGVQGLRGEDQRPQA
mmetsp:Transcript_153563/g.492171  ORF Transcript_153563/g.492171 Transcript_153563/m.492171 type:complete len:272 (+) Transcript_153563:897-1712(+)